MFLFFKVTSPVVRPTYPFNFSLQGKLEFEHSLVSSAELGMI
jgi:hypothetical protein